MSFYRIHFNYFILLYAGSLGQFSKMPPQVVFEPMTTGPTGRSARRCSTTSPKVKALTGVCEELSLHITVAVIFHEIIL